MTFVAYGAAVTVLVLVALVGRWPVSDSHAADD
jgi:hypothetical protein